MIRQKHLEIQRHVEAIALSRFPDAPAGSWVSEEGWLIIGDEAFTEHEWSGNEGRLWRRNFGRRGAA